MIEFTKTGATSSYLVHSDHRYVGLVSKRADGWHGLAPGGKSFAASTRAKVAQLLVANAEEAIKRVANLIQERKT